MRLRGRRVSTVWQHGECKEHERGASGCGLWDCNKAHLRLIKAKGRVVLQLVEVAVLNGDYKEQNRR